MIIGFKHQFVDKILSCEKVHTIRIDKHDRWKARRIMHMATGVRTTKYNCFNIEKVDSIQSLLIDTYHEEIGVLEKGIVHHWLTKTSISHLTKNDGFDSEKEFWEWFKCDPYTGPYKLIHWMPLKY